MGLLDDALDGALPGGGIAKPIAIAIGALLLRNMFSGGGSQPAPTPAPAPAGDPNGGLFGGLQSLVEKFQNAGHGPAVQSWIGTGPNQPIQPAQVGAALGRQTIGDLARQAGVSEQELLNALSKALPGVVDKLTPQGALPSPWGNAAR